MWKPEEKKNWIFVWIIIDSSLKNRKRKLKNKIPIKKSWGQHFLIDNNMIDKIIKIIDPKKNNTILEIGPGTGAITIKLCKVQIKLIIK